ALDGASLSSLSPMKRTSSDALSCLVDQQQEQELLHPPGGAPALGATSTTTTTE
ncbi:unnamed protein product, partial [Amoebophrya sp. A25]